MTSALFTKKIALMFLSTGLLFMSACQSVAPSASLTQFGTGKMKMQGHVNLYNTVAGSQNVEYSVFFAELYGTRVEIVGPAGTALLYANVNPSVFEAYSMLDRALIRDKTSAVLERADRSMLSLSIIVIAAIVSYGTAFSPSAMFDTPEVEASGFRSRMPEPFDRINVRWIETKSTNDLRPKALEQIVIDTGFTFVYADRQQDNSYRVHFGSTNPVMDIYIDSLTDQYNLQGIQWQLMVPPGSEVYNFSQYLASQPAR